MIYDLHLLLRILVQDLTLVPVKFRRSQGVTNKGHSNLTVCGDAVHSTASCKSNIQLARFDDQLVPGFLENISAVFTGGEFEIVRPKCVCNKKSDQHQC